MRQWIIALAAVSRAQTVHGLVNFIARPGGPSQNTRGMRSTAGRAGPYMMVVSDVCCDCR